MIIESLKIWLFGTAGLFIVMGIIVVVIVALNFFGNRSKKEQKE